MSILYINARIFTGEQVLERGSVVVENGRIINYSSDDSKSPGEYDEIIDLQGLSIAPAFIDLQVYGGNGKLFNNEPTAEAIQKTWESVRAGGASHFQITLSCSPLATMWQAMNACREYWAQGGQGLLGLHLEGPYFNPEKRGAHPLKNIRKSNPAEVAELIEHGKGVLRYMTFAPEMMDEASLDLLLQSDIALSLGHSNATFQQAIRALEKGIERVTHLFNAMSPFQSREPGLVGAAFARKPWTSIIADGIHCDFNSLKISKELLRDKLFLISDAVTESLMGDYRFRFSGDRYVDESGVLAGSALTMWQAVKNVVQFADIPLEEALRMASTYPAQVVGEGHRLGKIAPGYEAHFVVFDEALELKELITAGLHLTKEASRA